MNHGSSIMEEESWKGNHAEGIMEEQSCKGIMEEHSCTRYATQASSFSHCAHTCTCVFEERAPSISTERVSYQCKNTSWRSQSHCPLIERLIDRLTPPAASHESGLSCFAENFGLRSAVSSRTRNVCRLTNFKTQRFRRLLFEYLPYLFLVTNSSKDR